MIGLEQSDYLPPLEKDLDYLGGAPLAAACLAAHASNPEWMTIKEAADRLTVMCQPHVPKMPIKPKLEAAHYILTEVVGMLDAHDTHSQTLRINDVGLMRGMPLLGFLMDYETFRDEDAPPIDKALSSFDKELSPSQSLELFRGLLGEEQADVQRVMGPEVREFFSKLLRLERPRNLDSFAGQACDIMGNSADFFTFFRRAAQHDPRQLIPKGSGRITTPVPALVPTPEPQLEPQIKDQESKTTQVVVPVKLLEEAPLRQQKYRLPFGDRPATLVQDIDRLADPLARAVLLVSAEDPSLRMNTGEMVGKMRAWNGGLLPSGITRERVNEARQVLLDAPGFLGWSGQGKVFGPRHKTTISAVGLTRGLGVIGAMEGFLQNPQIRNAELLLEGALFRPASYICFHAILLELRRIDDPDEVRVMAGFAIQDANVMTAFLRAAGVVRAERVTGSKRNYERQFTGISLVSAFRERARELVGGFLALGNEEGRTAAALRAQKILYSQGGFSFAALLERANRPHDRKSR